LITHVARRRRLGMSVILSLLLSAFYIVPFVVYRGQLTSSKILGPNLVFLLLIQLGFLVVSGLLRERISTQLFSIALLMILPIILGKASSELEELLPAFHYYRFGILSLYLGAIGIGVLLETLSTRPVDQLRRRVFWGVSLSTLAFAFYQFAFFSPPMDNWAFQKTRLDLNSLGSTDLEEYGRYWVIGVSRSADFGIDSVLQARDEKFRSVTGLYWESSRNNLQLSSYLATLLASPVVLDHYHYWGYGCDIQECVMEHFFRDYNIRGWMLPEDMRLPYLRPERQLCYQQILAKGETDRYFFRKLGSFRASGIPYGNYRIEMKPWKALSRTNSNRAVDIIDFSDVTPYDDKNSMYFADAFKSVFDSCKKGIQSDSIFMKSSPYQKLKGKMVQDWGLFRDSPVLKNTPTLERVAPGRFKLEVPVERDVLIRIKLNYYPMFELRREDGSRVELYDAFPSILAYAHGTLILEFKRSWVMISSAVLSAFTVFFVFLFWRKLGAEA
ncbi:MAG: hypothetical protein KGQ59_09205, partial [Bdellovibrionales bacterium]|nr:hypothetical protein [Bdellovibrionales bacterium]